MRLLLKPGNWLIIGPAGLLPLRSLKKEKRNTGMSNSVTYHEEDQLAERVFFQAVHASTSSCGRVDLVSSAY